jgi:hypothetical protein
MGGGGINGFEGICCSNVQGQTASHAQKKKSPQQKHAQLVPGFLHGLLFDPEYEGSMFLQNVSLFQTAW